MGRRAVLIAVLLSGVVLGLVLGPRLLPGVGPTTDATTTRSAAPTPSRTQAPAPLPTPPSPPPSSPTPSQAAPEPSPVELAEQAADAAAGVTGHDIPVAAGGALAVLPGVVPAPGAGSGVPVLSVRVEAEIGLPIDLAAFGTFVMDTLNDPRGWGHDGSVSFARTDGPADIRVLVGSPSLVDVLCAPLRTVGQYSCGRNGHAALNAIRWVDGAQAFLGAGGDLTSYRQYLVTHEVGHLLGHPHRRCPAAGAVAPVMLQQSITLEGCVPNAWPGA